MRITIEDLEALKDLNDELEDGHVETEKQQRDEIALLEALLQQNATSLEVLQDAVADRETTIGQFRDLVNSLQG